MSTYYVVLDGQVEGPVEMTEIVALMHEGKVRENTQVCVCDAEKGNVWMTWRRLRPDLFGNPVATPPPLTVYYASQALAELRKKTAYPRLRLALKTFAVIDVVAAALFIFFTFFDTDHASTYAILAAASLMGIVPLALSHSVIDVADATLRKL